MNEIEYALNSFQRWMNRPLAKVQVYTWHLANELDPNCPSIRLLAPYRDDANKAFRWRLPHFDEATSRYVHTATNPARSPAGL